MQIKNWYFYLLNIQFFSCAFKLLLRQGNDGFDVKSRIIHFGIFLWQKKILNLFTISQQFLAGHYAVLG